MQKSENRQYEKTAKWLAATALAVFVLDWAIVGLKLLDGDYAITAVAWIGLAALVIFFVCVIWARFANRCSHCGKAIPAQGSYCLHCGKALR